MKKSKVVVLALVLFFYAGLYLATTKKDVCITGDCEKIFLVTEALRNAKSYVYSANRCTYRQGSDTLCIFVKDTTGVNWNALADTACLVAQDKGLLQQKIFIIKADHFPNDTVARKVCP